MATVEFSKKLVTEKYANLKPEQIDWVWENKIPNGAVTLLVGDPGTGKSILSLYIAGQVSAGRKFPNCGNPTKQGTVLIITAEDNHTATVLPRLMATDANLDKIERTVCVETVITGSSGESKSLKESMGADLMSRLDLLEARIKEIPDFKLLIIDTIPSYLGSSNLSSIVDIRAFVDSLSVLALKYKIAILGITHFNKNQDVPAQYRVIGSIGMTGGVRAVWGIVKDENDPSRRLMASGKLNLTADTTGLAFKLDNRQLQIEGKPAWHARCLFEAEPIQDTLDNLLMPGKSGKGSPKKNEAAVWLLEYLSDGMKHTVSDVIDAAKCCDIKEKTLRRAARSTNVKTSLIIDEVTKKFGGHEWSLLS